MIKTLRNLFKQDKEKFVVPKSVQAVIPLKTVWEDGIFLVGKNKYAKTFKFEDINYAVASREDKEAMFLEYSELLNALDSGATTKITINNRRLNKADFEQTILIPLAQKGGKAADDGLDRYRKEYNKMLLDKATGANSIVQDKYVTISVCKKNIEEARNYFARVGADLIGHFNRLGSRCTELDASDKLRIFHDFYRTGEETAFHFDMAQTMRKGHDFKDIICPDTFEFEKDYFRIGDRYGRVIFLREYAAYIKDSMVAELCELNRNMMLSVDVVPVPTDEAVREVENRLLGVETNITNWQRKQNQNDNLEATLSTLYKEFFTIPTSAELPFGWKIAPFSDIATVIMGQSPESEDCNNDGSGNPLLNGPTEFGFYSPTPVQWTTNSNLEATAQAVFEDYFAEYYAGALPLPNGWKKAMLSDVCQIRGGKRLPAECEFVSDITSHPYVRIRDMYQGKYLELTEDFEYIGEDVFAYIRNYTVASGDVIIAIVGITSGEIAIIGKTLDGANLTENCVKLTNYNGITAEYLYCYWQYLRKNGGIDPLLVGAAQPKLPMYNIQSVPVIIPDDATMDNYQNRAAILAKGILNNIQEIKCLREIQQLIVSRLLSR